MNGIGRNSLQNENSLFKRKSYDQRHRSNSVDCRGRSSKGLSYIKPRSSSSEERKSANFLGSNGPRRSSTMNEAKVLLKDPRPLKDKAYQKKKSAELIQFLQETNFPYQMTVSKLLQPSKKDFENIFKHLMSFWDEMYVVKRIEDEAPKLLKDLCYPFTINKSAFLHVARTNWPPLLGILIFLMDITWYAHHIDPKTIFNSGEVLLEIIYGFYTSKNEDEEEVKKVFTDIIRKSLIPYNTDELLEENKEYKDRVENVKAEIDKINYLISERDRQHNELVKYEDYFLKMKDHKNKKVEICQKLSDELAAKEDEVLKLNAIRDKKQEAYDAQGFDGKKQVLYYEEQKKELHEKLQAKKAALKDIQQKCWEAEIQYSQTMDEGSSVSETFNEQYSSVLHASDKVLNALQSIQDPRVKSLCSDMHVAFPDCKMKPMQNVFSQGSSVRTKLEEIQKKIDSTNGFFKCLLSQQSQNFNEHEIKISELSLAIKVAAAQETQKERELSSKREQAKDKRRELENKCDETLKSLEKIRAERMEVENYNKELSEELLVVEKLKKDKHTMLDNYLISSKERFSRYSKEIEKTQQLSKQCGQKIYEALQKHFQM